MKIKVILIFLSILVCGSFYSCSNEDDDGGYAKRRDQENTIKYKVSINTSDVPVSIRGINGLSLIIKDSWEGEYVTKKSLVQFEARCKDENVLITCEIYVNGKLRLKREGNAYVMLEIDDIKR
ncbi:hypothetical protein [Labilibaculum euxinus]|uniref:Lipoprotein n=1 Tax=Labilibaculum euxinus TaxID=2686357 RepID=A0A7M4D2F3_9BACT|nr:hypothetical protein [Labilibaculum euxinus]MUP36832.1 hypothetical protein [Labilibaculum euxinus]MVB06037.1 hypothetical protein [Labilibaculum euxinus]